MLSKLFGKNDSKETDENSKLKEKISKMDLAEMRIYVNGKLDSYKVNEVGLNEIVKKLMSRSQSTSKLYIAENDMDSKRKKVFDLLLLILENKKISMEVVESAQEFIKIYDEVLEKYDYDNKDIYKSKIIKKISKAADMVNIKSDINDAMKFSR